MTGDLDPATAAFLADRRLSRSARRAVNRLVSGLGARVVETIEHDAHQEHDQGAEAETDDDGDDESGDRASTDDRVCAKGKHSWYWYQSGEGVEDWCEQPSLFVCEYCAMVLETRCGAASMRKCAPCARRHKRRVRKVFNSGLIRETGEHVWWLTLTAPGDDQHWNPHTGDICLCTDPGGADPAVFNTRLPRAWSDLITYVRRSFGPVEYAKSIEVQGRRCSRTGRAFLHIHSLVRTGVDLGAQLEDLRTLVVDLGFGHSLELVAAEPRHAAYAAKYASGSVDERHQVEWLIDGEAVRGAPRMRTWTCSRHWGDTMRDIKQAEIGHPPEVWRTPL